MAECELRQRKKEEDRGEKLQENKEEAKSGEQDQPQTENKSEPVSLAFIWSFCQNNSFILCLYYKNINICMLFI